MSLFKRKFKSVDPSEETEDIYNSEYYDISLKNQQPIVPENTYNEDFPSTIEKIQPVETMPADATPVDATPVEATPVDATPTEDGSAPEIETAEEIADAYGDIEEIEKVDEAGEELAPTVSVYAPKDNYDCQAIVEDLKNGGIVIIDTSDMEGATILRTFDFILGAVFALDAELLRRDFDTVVVGPKGVDLEEFCDTYGEQDDTEE